MSEKDLTALLNITDSANKIRIYVKELKNADEFFDSVKGFDVFMMNFIFSLF